MWPRLLAQLLELLPHVSSLVPMADRYLASRSATENAQTAHLATLAETACTDLGAITQSQADLTAELASQNRKLDHIIAQIALNRVELTAYADHLQTVTQQLKRLRIWVISSAIFSALLLLAILILLLRSA